MVVCSGGQCVVVCSGGQCVAMCSGGQCVVVISLVMEWGSMLCVSVK